MIIDTDQALVEACGAMAHAPILAVDTETNGLHAYRSRICIIQISDGERVWLIDALPFHPEDARVPGAPLSTLFDLFENPGILKILHGASHDISSLKEDYGRGFLNIFDTYIAAQMLNYEKIGLSSLVEKHCGIVLSKTLQKADWGKRPLDESTFHYLRHDVLYLLPIHAAIMRELEAADLVEEAQLESQHEEGLSSLQPSFDANGFWRMKGSETLDDHGLAFLKHLYRLRDQIAHDLNRPAFKVIPDQLLITWAGKKTLEELRQESFLYRRQVKPILSQILEQFRASREEARPSKPPRSIRSAPVHTHDRSPSRPVRERIETALKEWRKQESVARGVATCAVLPNHVLDHLVFDPPKQIEDLMEIPCLGVNRRRRYGERLLAIVATALAE